MDIRLLLQVFATVRQARRRDRWALSRLEVYRADALRYLRQHTYAHSPFYQKCDQGLTDRPLQELPVLTKAIMMEHFDDLMTDRAIRLEAVRTYLANFKEGQRFLDR
jgi:phenylacetate-CoA ligase